MRAGLEGNRGEGEERPRCGRDRRWVRGICMIFAAVMMEDPALRPGPPPPPPQREPAAHPFFALSRFSNLQVRLLGASVLHGIPDPSILQPPHRRLQPSGKSQKVR